jgi:hypothetical protein
MSQNGEYYEFWFKIVYTSISYTIQFDPETTIEKFKEIVFDKYPNNLFEIVEAGQFNNINGRDPEVAPAINYPSESTLREIYDKNWKTTAFYLRPLPSNQE